MRTEWGVNTLIEKVRKVGNLLFTLAIAGDGKRFFDLLEGGDCGAIGGFGSYILRAFGV